jgi:hypothetical protein
MATIKEQLKEKFKALTSALSAIEKQFGKGAIMSLGGGETPDIPRSSVPSRRARPH